VYGGARLVASCGLCGLRFFYPPYPPSPLPPTATKSTSCDGVFGGGRGGAGGGAGGRCFSSMNVWAAGNGRCARIRRCRRPQSIGALPARLAAASGRCPGARASLRPQYARRGARVPTRPAMGRAERSEASAGCRGGDRGRARPEGRVLAARRESSTAPAGAAKRSPQERPRGAFRSKGTVPQGHTLGTEKPGAATRPATDAGRSATGKRLPGVCARTLVALARDVRADSCAPIHARRFLRAEMCAPFVVRADSCAPIHARRYARVT